jgi:hypothetical protein
VASEFSKASISGARWHWFASIGHLLIQEGSNTDSKGLLVENVLSPNKENYCEIASTVLLITSSYSGYQRIYTEIHGYPWIPSSNATNNAKQSQWAQK